MTQEQIQALHEYIRENLKINIEKSNSWFNDTEIEVSLTLAGDLISYDKININEGE